MWRGPIEQPPERELRRGGPANLDVFVIQGRRITETIQAQLEALGIGQGARVLDFGAGLGRVAMPLHEATGLPTDACDVNGAAMNYLAGQLPDVACETTSFAPGLPYTDDTFDAVYAIAVWTHLPEDMGQAWLQEIKRILKPNGVALISTSGRRAVEVRAEAGLAGWSEYSADDLERAGILFHEFTNIADPDDAYPGVTSAYGISARHPDHIRAQWSAVMTVEDIQLGAVDGVQDLVILRNEGAGPARKPRSTSKSRSSKSRSSKTGSSKSSASKRSKSRSKRSTRSRS